MHVLAVGCHPDDIEICCGGTLAKCVKRGDTVTVCHIANGNLGHVSILPDALREIRIGEAKKSGQLCGITVHTIDVGDLHVDSSNLEQRDKLTNLIKSVKPDFIITHSPNDYMRDHIETSKLVFDASFAASIPHYANPGFADITPIFYMDNAAGVNFTPTEYVDITEEIDMKLEMLKCHESQYKWLMDHDNIDYLEQTQSIARFRGIQCGVRYAEGFTREIASLRNTTIRLLP